MSVERIGLPDGTRHPRLTRCSGALLVVSAEEYRVLGNNGLKWAAGNDVPAEGKASARVWCDRDEASLERNGCLYTYGLCGACAELEANQRRDLRDRAKAAEGRR